MESIPSFSEDLKSFDENIEDLNQGIHYLLWKRHPKLMWTVWGITFLLMVPLLYLASVGIENGESSKLLLIGLLPFLLPATINGLAVKRVRTLFFKQLADGLGLTYSPSVEPDSAVGHLFSVGNDRSLTDVLSGTYHGYPLRIFTLMYATGSGKSREVHRFTVCELTFPKKLPGLMVIGEDTPSGGEVSWQPMGAKPLLLEGTFNKGFNVYVEVGRETDALRILEPDFMALLWDKYGRYGFECCEDRLNIFTYEFPLQKTYFGMDLSHVDDLLDRLIPELEGVERSPT